MVKSICDRCGADVDNTWGRARIVSLENEGDELLMCKECEGGLRLFVIGKEKFMADFWVEVREKYQHIGRVNFLISVIGGFFIGLVFNFFALLFR